ncbi:MAG: indole-3-glycerol phosphate synthase TrpC [Phycisphaerae bacterium]|nr:indole-3-glycerol phosphate synthase TrpC [Phycisphaerae bacterium]
MADILKQIIAAKRAELADARAAAPLEKVREDALASPQPRNFFRALTSPNPARKINLIAEIKRRSPSAGLIRPDFDVEKLAKTYESAGAQALSVLTDRTFFGGELSFLAQARAAVSLPVLRKDFIIDAYQVYEARAAGADAILLIAEALPIGQLLDLLILSTELHMSTLIEVHDAESLMQVRSVPGFPQEHFALLGINNRNLKTMTTDLGTTARLMSLLDDGTPVVAESGIRTRADVERMIRVGVAALLIGETFMRSDDVASKVRELMDGKGSGQ